MAVPYSTVVEISSIRARKGKSRREADLPSMRMLQVHRFGAVLALLLLLALAGVVLALIYVPWRQSVTGRGAVSVFSPDDRPQSVSAQIGGRLLGWHAVEGDHVEKGQLLCRLQDVDSKYLDPEQPRRMRAQVEAMRLQRQIVVDRLEVLAAQREAMLRSRDAALPAASEKILQSEDRLDMARQSVRVAQQSLETNRLNFERVRTLHAEGLKSTRDLELARQTWVASQTEVERSKDALDAAGRDVSVVGLDRRKLEADIDGNLQKLADEMLKARETTAKIDSDLQKMEVEIANLKGRMEQRDIVAPVTGRLVRVLKVGTGETVKSGDTLAMVFPESRDQAVELYLDDFDAPLVQEGRQVRLMFDGFPAVPFVAFHWMEVGTFAGKVRVVDAVDDGAGKFRLLVVPDREAIAAGESEWPPSNLLRPGTQAMGWVMLDEVPLYWEVWRRLNAFPPVPPDYGQGDGYNKKSSGGKKDKAKTKPVLGK